jgi:hypothetical protein
MGAQQTHKRFSLVSAQPQQQRPVEARLRAAQVYRYWTFVQGDRDALKRLWIAVTSMPFFRNSRINGLTSSACHKKVARDRGLGCRKCRLHRR